jgi:hypothetical protein
MGEVSTVARYIAQVTLQSVSGLSKDRFENVWHFTSGTTVVSELDAKGCALRLQDFYSGGTHPSANVAWYLSPKIQGGALVKVYDEDAPGGPHTRANPRPILYEATWPIGAPSTGDLSLPEEVALAVSYYSSANAPRHRGRIYIGPLNTAGLESDTEVRPSANMIASFVAAATRLIATGDGAIPVSSLSTLSGITDPGDVVAPMPDWALRSKIGTGTKIAPIVTYELATKGWVDNEWDAQRRRRVEASARVSFP